MTQEKRKLLILLFSSIIVCSSVAYLFFQKPSSKQIKEKSQEKTEKVPRFKINLDINDSKTTQTYTGKIDEGANLLDLLEILRKEEKLTYDLTSYSKGEKIESINNVYNPKFVWNLYIEGQPSTTPLKSVILNKEYKYKLQFEQKIL